MCDKTDMPPDNRSASTLKAEADLRKIIEAYGLELRWDGTYHSWSVYEENKRIGAHIPRLRVGAYLRGIRAADQEDKEKMLDPYGRIYSKESENMVPTLASEFFQDGFMLIRACPYAPSSQKAFYKPGAVLPPAVAPPRARWRVGQVPEGHTQGERF